MALVIFCLNYEKYCRPATVACCRRGDMRHLYYQKVSVYMKSNNSNLKTKVVKVVQLRSLFHIILIRDKRTPLIVKPHWLPFNMLKNVYKDILLLYHNQFLIIKMLKKLTT